MSNKPTIKEVKDVALYTAVGTGMGLGMGIAVVPVRMAVCAAAPITYPIIVGSMTAIGAQAGGAGKTGMVVAGVVGAGVGLVRSIGAPIDFVLQPVIAPLMGATLGMVGGALVGIEKVLQSRDTTSKPKNMTNDLGDALTAALDSINKEEK